MILFCCLGIFGRTNLPQLETKCHVSESLTVLFWTISAELSYFCAIYEIWGRYCLAFVRLLMFVDSTLALNVLCSCSSVHALDCLIVFASSGIWYFGSGILNLLQLDTGYCCVGGCFTDTGICHLERRQNRLKSGKLQVLEYLRLHFRTILLLKNNCTSFQ